MHVFNRFLFSFFAGLSLFFSTALIAQTAEYISISLTDGTVSPMNADDGADWAELTASKRSRLVMRKVAAGSTAGITIEKDYYLAVHELTAAQRDFLRETPVGISGTVPFGGLSEADVLVILDALHAKTSATLPGGTFSIPTTNQWSFAAHGRIYTAPYTLSTGGANTLTSADAWFSTVEINPKDVGIFLPNTLGLYDMHGNASELAYADGNKLFMMGGDWHSDAAACTASSAVAWAGSTKELQDRAAIRICYMPPSATAMELTVDGESMGLFEPGQMVTVTAATTLPDVAFSHWQWSPGDADLGEEFDAAAQTTVVTMPAQAVSLTSVWAQRYTLTVDGVVQGAYFAGSSVPVAATPPTSGLTFNRWSWLPAAINPGAEFNDSLAATTLTMPEMDVELISSWVFTGDFISVKIDSLVTSMATEAISQVAYPLPAKYKDTHVLLRRFKGGAFTIGTPASEPGRSEDYELQHQVILTSDRYVSITEITRAHWGRMMTPGVAVTNGSHPMLAAYSDIRGTSIPTATPSLNSFMGLFQTRFTAFSAKADLPTDAEWEVACRAGTAGSWNNGTTITAETLLSDPNLDLLGVYNAKELAAVATKFPSAAGLYDMHGNAAEWCRDQFTAYTAETVTDPVTVWSDYFVLRGGSHSADAAACRSGARAFTQLGSSTAGFRLQLTLPALRQVIVKNGSGTGTYDEGSSIAIAANAAPAGYSFSRWIVAPEGTDLGSAFTATDSSTAIIVPGGNVMLTASYAPGLLLDVRGGTGGGYFEQGRVVAISASATASDSQIFDKWVVTPASTYLGPSFTSTDSDTFVTMPGQGVTITATWKDSRGEQVPVNVVKGTANAKAARPGEAFTAEANPATFGWEFDRWVVEPSTLSLSGAYTTSVSLTVPATYTAASNITLTASYKLKGNYAIFNVSSNAVPRPLSFADSLPADSKKANLVLRRVEPGTFMMGSAPNSAERKLSANTSYYEFDETAHEETITQPFYIGVYELTQGQWSYISTGATSTSELPQASITYNASLSTYVAAIAAKTALPGFNLPTQAQWEYACRAGNTNGYYNVDGALTGSNFSTYARAIAWSKDNASAAQAVGSKAPNAWGLYDMSGNVEEWALAESTSSTYVYTRGGSYFFYDLRCRSASRQRYSTRTGGVDGANGMRVLYNPPAVYTLTVEGGRGSAGVIEAGQTSMIAAVIPDGKRFVRWQGSSLAALDSATAAVAIVTMPEEDATYTAVFEDIPVYQVTVVGGVGSVSLPGPGIATGISAALPPAGQVFAEWSISPAGTDLGADFDAASPNTSLTLSSAGRVTLTATYQAKRPGARLMIR